MISVTYWIRLKDTYVCRGEGALILQGWLRLRIRPRLRLNCSLILGSGVSTRLRVGVGLRSGLGSVFSGLMHAGVVSRVPIRVRKRKPGG